MATDLIPVLLPRKEVQQRLVMARQTAKTARTLAGGVAQFAAKSQRSSAKIAKYTAQAEECDAIAASCVEGLNGAKPETQSDAQPTRVLIPVGGMEDYDRPEPVLTAADVDEDGG